MSSPKRTTAASLVIYILLMIVMALSGTRLFGKTNVEVCVFCSFIPS